MITGRGRKAVPTALKVLRGNPGRRPQPEYEPHPDPAIPDPPEWLIGSALEEWQRITPQLHLLGLVSHLDRATLVSYCQAWGELADASAVTRSSKHPSPDMLAKLSAVRRKAREHLAKFSSLFGFSPADRTRIHAPPKEKTGSPLERLRQPIR